MYLSIIVPTIGRLTVLEDLLFSIIAAEITHEFELLIIDQNPSGYLDEVVSKFKTSLNILHFNVDFKGLSRAKNFGASKASGRYLSFPDDDCRILPKSYDKAFNIINDKSVDILFGRCIDDVGNNSVLNFNNEPYYLSLKNMEGGFVEATVIVKKEIFEKFRYDENMGAGCFFGAEEGYDWLYRILIEKRYNVYYTPEITFYHPQIILDKGDYRSLQRVFTYRCGAGYLCQKNKLYKKFFKRISLTSLAAIFYLFFNLNKSRYYLLESCSLATGWLLSRAKK